MGLFIVLISIMLICIVVVRAAEVSDKSSQQEYNGKRYRYVSVDMDVKKGFHDNINVTLGRISQQEYKWRHKNGAYSICAWVEVGKEKYSWKNDPINRDTFLLYASEHERLPDYLLEEMHGSKDPYRRPLVGDYKAWIKENERKKEQKEKEEKTKIKNHSNEKPCELFMEAIALPGRYDNVTGIIHFMDYTCDIKEYDNEKIKNKVISHITLFLNTKDKKITVNLYNNPGDLQKFVKFVTLAAR